MLHKVGLLPPDNRQQVPFAYKMYTKTDRFGWEQSNNFKRAFCIDVQIEFMGVWYDYYLYISLGSSKFRRDTVASVGIIPRRLPFTTSNTIVRTFRHAVSLDEHRAKFKANLWHRPTEAEQKLGTTAASTRRSTLSAVRDRMTRQRNSFTAWDHNAEDHLLSEMERTHSAAQDKPTDVEEVWFAVCSDILITWPDI